MFFQHQIHLIKQLCILELFDLFYLLFAIISGILLIRKARNETERSMGIAALILGCGDAFHLIPRVLHYFIDADLTAALGIGKLVTSLTMTVFYVYMYRIYRGYYGEKKDARLFGCICCLAALRLILCLFPQNGWLQNENGAVWGIVRNIPFVALGAVIAALYFKKRRAAPRFRLMWLLITLSFLFYIPVAVGAGLVPMLGMLMLPKTVCYILILVLFRLAVTKDEPRGA